MPPKPDKTKVIKALVEKRASLYYQIRDHASEILVLVESYPPTSLKDLNDSLSLLKKLYVSFIAREKECELRYKSLSDETEGREDLLPTSLGFDKSQEAIEDITAVYDSSKKLLLNVIQPKLQAKVKSETDEHLRVLECNMTIAKDYLQQMHFHLDPSFGSGKSILNLSQETELAGLIDSFENLLVESGEKLKICESVLEKYPIDSDLDDKLTQFKSEVSTAHFEVKKFRLRVTENKKLRKVTFNDQKSYHSADYGSGSREEDDFHDPPPDGPVDASANVLPNYRAMRRANAGVIKGKALKAIQPQTPLSNDASQHEIAKRYIAAGGGGWSGAGGGPGYHDDGLSYPKNADGTLSHKQTLPFKYDKQPIPQFSGWAVDYQLFKIKWSHLEQQFRGEGSEWQLAELLKKNCLGHAQIILSSFAPSPYYYDQMWAALDESFGTKSKELSDLLRRITVLGSESVDTRNAMNYLSWMNKVELCRNQIISVSTDWFYSVTPDMVKNLASRLPYQVQRDWFSVFDDFTRTGKETALFEEFVHFLEQERRFVESQADIGVRPARPKDPKLPRNPKKLDEDSNFGDSKGIPRGNRKDSSPSKNPRAQNPTKPNYNPRECFYCAPSNPKHYLKSCEAWKGLSREDRRLWLIRNKRCLSCFNSKSDDRHKGKSLSSCTIHRYLCSKRDCEKNGKGHNILVSCNASNLAVNHAAVSKTAIFAINRANIVGTKFWLNAFHDDGSTGSFIMTAAARKRRLKRIGRSDLTVNTMGGGTMNLVSWTYEIPIETKTCGTHFLYAHGVDDFLIKPLRPLDLDLLRSEFPDYDGGFEDLQYQSLTAELLIGLSDARLLPRQVLHDGVNEVNLQIRTGELGDTVMGSYLDPCNTDNRSNSIAVRIGGECYQSGDISVSLHSNNLSVCKEFPTKMLQVPKFSKSLLEQNVNYSGPKQQRHRSLNNKTVCSEHIVERQSAHELEGGSIHVDSVETDVLCGHSKVGVFSVNVLKNLAYRKNQHTQFAQHNQVREFEMFDEPSSLVKQSYLLPMVFDGQGDLISPISCNTSLDKSGELDSSEYSLTKRETKAFKELVDRFLAGENFLTAITPLCGGCKCGKCPIPGHTYSFKEEQELQMIRAGLHFDEEKGMWIASYPWLTPPSALPDNKWQAVKILESVERRLKRNPDWIPKYQDQVDDLLDRNSARKLTQQEINDHQGPYFYVTHMLVLNPKSNSTPIRMVFNSSLKSQGGLSMNDCLAKGPDAYLNKLIGVLIRWREYKSAFIGDVSKMYHAVALSESDQHMHRFLWRDMRTDDPPETYVMKVVTFGDKPAGTTAEEAMYQQARSMLDTHPQATETILRSSYVDDIDHSIDDSGERCLSLIKDIVEVLDKGGFKVKEWWISGENQGRTSEELNIPYGKLTLDPSRESKLKSSIEGYVGVLGVLWDPMTDTLRFQSPFNFHTKKEIQRGAPLLQLNEFDSQFPAKLTRRDVLRQVARIYDPLGILSPFILQAKLLLRATLQEVGDNWDKVISAELYFKWKDWFRTAFEIDEIIIPRCMKPENSVGPPSLVVLSDGSEEAYGFTAYVRWKVGVSYVSNLLAAKCRIAPLNRVSIPQMELNGSVLAARARINLVSECSYKFSQIIHLVDSTTVLCQINNLSSRFKVYEGVRIGEIQAGGLIDSWYWVEGNLNVSDVVTRGKTPSELMDDDIWLHGPDFLKKEQSDWPIMSFKQVSTMRTTPLPGLKEVNLEQVFFISSKAHLGSYVTTRNQNKFPTNVNFGPISKDFLKQAFKPQNFSHLSVCLRAWSFILTSFALRSFARGKLFYSSKHYLDKTENVLVKFIQSEVMQDIEVGKDNMVVKSSKYSQFGAYVKNGILHVGFRAKSVLAPVVLPFRSNFTALVMRSCHIDVGHLGRDQTLATFCEKFFCVRASVLAARICKHCYKCRKTDLQLGQQLMGSVPDWRMQPALPFHYTQIDLFGPYAVAGEVQKRVRGKGYGIIFVDMVSKAIHIEFAPNYSTDAFLMAYTRFTSIRGSPKELYSDPGSQLTGAGAEVKEVWANINTDQIKSNPVFKGALWQFSPANSPHRQGLVESLIKSVKRAFKILENRVLSFFEMSTLFTRIADLVNSRPIGRIKQDLASGDITVLTPNSLLLGRGCAIPNANITLTSKLAPKLREIEEIVTKFWDRWIPIVRPSVTFLKKWDTQKRNLQVGDVVMICASSKLAKTYQLAIVSKNYPSSTDGLVRKVDLTIKRLKDYEKGGCPKYSGSSEVVVSRSVQGLALIVPIDELDETYGEL